MDREMGNETEFETRNGHKWETKRYKKHHFSTKKKKNREKNRKNRGKNTKKQEKTGKKQKITRKTETKFRRDFGKC